MTNNKRFLDTPLFDASDTNGWKNCLAKNIPFASFRKQRKYGEYWCDFTTVQRSRLSVEGIVMIDGVFEGMLARWILDKKVAKKQSYEYYHGPSSIYLNPCPVGEELYIHHAVCRVLARCMVKCKLDSERANHNPMDPTEVSQTILPIINKQFLQTPLFDRSSMEDRNSCSKDNLPHAVFIREGKYSVYKCDLIHVHGFKPVDEWSPMIQGVFEAILARWFIDKKIPKPGKVSFSIGADYILISPCPLGEEVYIHHAICSALARCMVKSDK